MLIFYDYEVFKHNWLVVFIDPINDVKTVIVDDVVALQQFHEKHKEHIYVGFNSRHYDQYIHKAILLGFDPYEVSQFIIAKKRKGWEYSNLFNKVKMYNYDVYKGMTDNGLKTLEAFMGNDIEETSVPFDIDRPLTQTEITETIKYCTHDVEQLIQVFLERQDDFNTHLAMINEFGLSLDYINKTTAQLIAVILGSVKTDYNDEWDIFLPDTLRLKKYWYIAEWLKNNRSLDSYNVNVAGVPHIFGDGGIHGAIPKFKYVCKNDEIIIFCDATSLYPFIMILYDLLSRSVKDKEKFKHIVNMNVELKKLKDPRRPIYKLICNTAYGCSGDKYNPMYDPRNRRLVCIFGQVLLLDLLEKLEVVPSIKFFNNNTDGLGFIIKRKDFDLVDDIVYEFEQRTGLSFEFEFFKKIYQKDVNNYIAVPYGELYDEKGNPRWKSKGGYVKKLSKLDNDLPIVNEALNNYMVKDIPIEETIYNCTDLLKFQKVYKLTSNYDYVKHNGQKLLNKSYRVFASNDTNDTAIYKCKEVAPEKMTYGSSTGYDVDRLVNEPDEYLYANGEKCDKFAETPTHAFILNSDINKAPIPRKLNKQWYVDLAYKRLEQFIGGSNG